MPRRQDHAAAKPPLDDADIARLQELLDGLPEPLQPLDASSLDGFLCGLLLQPEVIAEARWMPFVTDVEGRALPTGCAIAELHTLVRRRRDELRRAIDARQWFDPWVFEAETPADLADTVLPWVAGFAAAMDQFPGLMGLDDTHLLEPLALLYLHFDPEDLEDAQALTELIETLEPPADLGEAVQDIVRSLMLMADVVRPLPAPTVGAGGAPKARKRR